MLPHSAVGHVLRAASHVSPWAVLVVMCVGCFLALFHVTITSHAFGRGPEQAKAIGIAVAGAIAGSPHEGHAFLDAFQVVAAGGACPYALVAVAGAVLLPGRLPVPTR